MTAMIPFEQEVERLEAALNRRTGKYKVKLSNVGNPDYRQDSERPLPDTVCGWAMVDTLAEASAICMLYISFFDLGGGNWSGGLVTDARGLVIGKVGYNGRVFEGAEWKSGCKVLFEP